MDDIMIKVSHREQYEAPIFTFIGCSSSYGWVGKGSDFCRKLAEHIDNREGFDCAYYGDGEFYLSVGNLARRIDTALLSHKVDEVVAALETLRQAIQEFRKVVAEDKLVEYTVTI